MDNTPDYTMQEIFMEVMADDSWEPDQQKREAAVFAVMMSVNF